MKIIVLTPRYTIAGVPLAQVRFARALALREHEVELVIGYVEPGNNLPELDNVKIRNLSKPSVKGMFLSIVKIFLKDKPDIIFVAEDHLTVMTLFAAIFSFSKTKISGSSRVTPFDTYSDIFLSKGWILKQLMKVVMWRANVLTCVSKDMVKQYATVFKKSPHICIYNIVNDSASRKKMDEPIDHPWLNQKNCPVIVAAGKLATWKGFENLIRIFPSVLKEKEIKLLILGDGPLREKLERQIQSLNLCNNIALLGYKDNPYPYYALADIFVLSSLVEGLPNVLVEAMMCGCTPVSTDCPTGPREVLNNGEYGYLVPVGDDKIFIESILNAVNFPIAHEKLQEAIKPFKETIVIDHHFSSLGY